MVHAMEYSIGTRVEKGGTLGYERKKIKKSFPGLTHRKHFVGCITVKEKRLAKKRQEPVREKKNENIHFSF
jgi:hypothetical protein